MFSNPIRILIASSLVMSGLGVLAIKVVGEKNEENFTTLVVSSNEADMEYKLEELDSKENTSGSTLEGCSVYWVEVSSDRKWEGNRFENKMKSMLSVSKVFKKFKDLKKFLDEQRLNNHKFVEDIEMKGCSQFRKVYVHMGSKSGTYSRDLQRKNGIEELKLDESKIPVS